MELGGSVIRIADPGGRWKFEAHSAQVNAKTVDGPFVLSPAEGRYQERGKEPVLMRAARADIDKQAQQVVLQGQVRIASDSWLLEADRVDYDLNTGKVVSPGRTKLSFGQGASKDLAGSSGGGEGR